MTKESRIIFGKIPTSPNGAFLLNPEEVSAWEKNVNRKLPDNTLFITSPFDIQETKPGKFIELTNVITNGDNEKEVKVTVNTDNITELYPLSSIVGELSGAKTYIRFSSGYGSSIKESYEFVSRLLMMNTSSDFRKKDD